MAGVSADIVARYFRQGAEVEISSNDEGFRDSWYAGTVVRTPRPSKRGWGKVLVEYKTLTEDEAGRRPLREEMDLVQLRPPQPPENRLKFESGEDVDAYYTDGWWEGTITEIEDDMYWVYFRGTREEIAFKASQLRVHREWVKEKWFPAVKQGQDLAVKQGLDFPSPSPPIDENVLLATEVNPKTETIKHDFSPGVLVEVSSDEEGFVGAWFAASVVKKLKNGKYLVRYQSLRNDDDTDFLTEEVDSLHIRPHPPDIGTIDRFSALDEVDALYNDGWWVGVVNKVLKDDRYFVYFTSTDEEMKFKHSHLRVHQEWINGKWIIASKSRKL